MSSFLLYQALRKPVLRDIPLLATGVPTERAAADQKKDAKYQYVDLHKRLIAGLLGGCRWADRTVILPTVRRSRRFSGDSWDGTNIAY
jgi:hypothetical protein